MKRIITVLAILCLFATGGAFLANTENADLIDVGSETTTRINYNVPGDYDTIQDAINAANPGDDSILVGAGVFKENLVIPSGTTIRIIGSGPTSTTIFGGFSGSVITVNQAGCTIRNLKVNGSGVQPSDAGIRLNTNNNIIENCNITRNNIGIYLNNSNYNRIANNTVYNNYGQPVVKDGLVGHWKMDEDSWDGTSGEVKDVSGYGNHGTAVNGADTAIGKEGRCGEFDGVDDYVEVPDDTSLDNYEQLSGFAWIRTSDNLGRIIAKDSTTYTGDRTGWALLATTQNFDGELMLYLGFTGDPGNFNQVHSGVAINDNKWHYVGFTWDSSKDLASIYIDGKLIHTESETEEIEPNNQPLTIGRGAELHPTDPFDGLIDEVRIYSRPITAEEVKCNFQNGMTSGIRSWNSHNNTMINNMISTNSGDGISSYSSHDNIIDNNTIEKNYRSGIKFENCTRNSINNSLIQSNYGLEPITDGLVGYWKMNEESWTGAAGEVKDSSSFGNDGTAINGTVTSKGKYGKTGDFDGSNDYIQIPETGSSELDLFTFSIGAWIMTKDESKPHQMIIAKRDVYGAVGSDYAANYKLFLKDIAGKPYPRILFGVDPTINDCESATSPEPVLEDQWYHVMGTYDGEELKMFVNGVEMASTPTTKTPYISDADLFLGMYSKGDILSTIITPFDGLIDEVKIFNRSLSTQEVLNDYLNGINAGINLVESSKNTIFNTTISRNSGNGVTLNNSNLNIIESNVLLDNNGTGFLFEDSDNNQIMGNSISSNDCVAPGLDVGLVGHWKMDEASWTGAAGEVKDSTGNGNDGTASTGVTPVSGIFGGAGDFDGANDHIDCGSDSSLKPQTLTVSAWINTETLASSKSRRIVDGDFSDSVRGYSLIQKPDNTLLFGVRNSGASIGRGDSSTTMSMNKWFHVVGTYDGSKVSIYVNGLLEDENPYSNTITYGSNPIEIGRYRAHPDDGYDFDGLIDEVRIYDRALSEKEVFDLYENGIKGGMFLLRSSSNQITDNLLMEQPNLGIYATDQSDNNDIYYNVLVDNGASWPQAIDDGTSNSWDDGAQGNYWSDWQSPDSAPARGIVDLPYDIQGSSASQDEYPVCLAIIPPTNVSAYEDAYYEGSVTSFNGFQMGPVIFTHNAPWLSTSPDGTISGMAVNSDVGGYWVNASISDHCTTKFVNFTLSVINTNDDPMIDTADVATTLEDQLYSVEYLATDIDPTGDVLTWALNTNASFLSIDGNTGNLSGTPVNADVGTYYVNVSVSDGHGGGDWKYYELEVLNTNDPPVWEHIPSSANIKLFQNYTYDVNASDVDVGDTLTYYIISSPASNIKIDAATGVITWQPNAAGLYEINISVSDGTAGLYYKFDLNVTTPLRTTLLSPDDGSVLDVANPTLEWAVDGDESYTVLYDVYFGESEKEIEDLDPSTRLAVGVDTDDFTFPKELDVGKTYYWTIIPRIGSDRGICDSGVWSFKIHENATVNNAPVFGSEPEITAYVDTLWEYTPDVTDVDGDKITIVLVSGPDGLVFLDGTFSWTPVSDQAGIHDFTIEASDGKVTVKQEFSVEVLLGGPPNSAPVIPDIPNATIKQGDDFTYRVLATDPDGDTISYSISGPGGMAISDTGLITWKPDKADVGEHGVKVTVSDGKTSSEANFRITVEKKDDGTSSSSLIFLAIGLIVVVLVILIVIVLIVLSRRKKKPEPGADVEEEEYLVSDSDDLFVEKRMEQIQEARTVRSSQVVTDINDQKAEPETGTASPDGLPPSASIEETPLLEAGDPDAEMIGDPVEEVEETELEDTEELEHTPPDLDNLEAIPPEMEQFMADGSESGVYHEASSGVWSPDMVEKRTSAESKTAMENLKELSKLRDDGILTDEEFEKKKRELLRKI